MYCTYGDHLATATHYYDTAGGNRRHLCASHAAGFGYPEYLVDVQPKRWKAEYGYLVATLNGTGEHGDELDTLPLDGSSAEWWLDVLGCPDVDGLLSDAAWEPYRAHYAVEGAWSYEVTRVTCLPLV